MKKLFAGTLVVTSIVAAGLLSAGEQNRRISGQVMEGSDKGIGGVQIRAYRAGHLVNADGKPTISDGGGSYLLEFLEGTPIDTVRYDHPDFFVSVVRGISGRNNHSIYKTLYLKKDASTLTPFQAYEVLSSLEMVLELGQVDDQPRLMPSYRKALGEIGNRSDLPAEVSEKAALLKRKLPVLRQQPIPETP